MAGAGLEQWRELFRGRDIYEVISKAVLIAATDSPTEFRRRRDGIVEQIYTAPATISTFQGRVVSAGEGCSARGTTLQVSDKASKVASCTVAPLPEKPADVKVNDQVGVADEHRNGSNGGNANSISEMEMDWLQKLADEMDAERQDTNEVLRIKEILLNHHEQSTDILFESLRRLPLMQLTADKITSTEIGRAVAALRKHKMHKIRMLVAEIIKDWKTVVDDWFAASKATMDDDSNKSLDISNPLSAKDEGGLATPPMDVGALFLGSQDDTAIMQNVSEFLHGTDDDEIMTNVISDMDTGGGCGSNNKFDGVKPSNTVPRSNDPIIVEASTVKQRPTFGTRNPQNLPAKERTPSRNTNPPQKLLNAAGNSLLRQQGRQSDLPARQEPGWQRTNIQKTPQQRPQIPRVPRIRIKMKETSTGDAPRRLSEKTLEKKPYDENQGTVTVTRNLPIVSAGELPSDQVVIKTGMPTQSLKEQKVGIGKTKVQLGDMNLNETKRKLHGAYQEAEMAKKKRAIQVLELCDIPKSKDTSSKDPLTTSKNLRTPSARLL